MTRLQSWYRKHLTIYVNHSDLDKKLKESDRSKSIIGFLRLGLIVLILSILASIGGYIALISNKASIATALQSYTSGIVAQLPANMTGSLTLSGGSATLHLNNDTPFTIDLLQGTDMEKNESEMDQLTVFVDTSLTTLPENLDSNRNSYHRIIIMQNGFAMHNDRQRRIYNFNEMNNEDTDHQETIALTQEMIQAVPSQLAGLIESHMASITGRMMLICLLICVIFGAIFLVIIALWYFFLCFVIRCLLSIVTSIRKKEIPHSKRDLVCILGFGPFVISFFFLSGRLYVIAMFIYLSILITQHHDFHQKK